VGQRIQHLEELEGAVSVAAQRCGEDGPQGGVGVLGAVLPHTGEVSLDVPRIGGRLIEGRREEDDEPVGLADQVLFHGAHGPRLPVGPAGARYDAPALGNGVELEHWRAALEKEAARARDLLRPAILETPHRDTYPAFGSLLVDDARRLWIGAYPRPGQPELRFVVIGPDGALHGIVAVPADAEVLDAAGDRLALARRSDLDEEIIEVLRIEWPTGSP
jgi:hypothetical protein